MKTYAVKFSITAKLVSAVLTLALLAVPGWTAAESGEPEKEDLKFGFIKLTDMAPLAIAYEKGYFEDEGLYVQLEAQANWKVLLDGVIDGQLDGAHMLAGQPLAATIGFGTKAHIVTPSGHGVSRVHTQLRTALLVGRRRYTSWLLGAAQGRHHGHYRRVNKEDPQPCGRTSTDAFAVISTGQMLTEEFYMLGKLTRGLIGTNNYDGNTTLCMASAVSGYKRSFGSDGPPGCYEDFEHTDCLMAWGSNLPEQHPIHLLAHERGAEGAWVSSHSGRTSGHHVGAECAHPPADHARFRRSRRQQQLVAHHRQHR